MTHSYHLLKKALLVCCLFLGIFSNAFAEIYIVAYFEDSTGSMLLNPKESPINFSLFTKTTGQDCLQILETSCSFEQSFAISSQSSDINAGNTNKYDFVSGNLQPL